MNRREYASRATPYANSRRLGSDDRALRESLAMPSQQFETQGPLSLVTYVHQPYDAGVWPAERHRELAEVLVQGDDDLLMVRRVCEDFRVAGVGRPVANPLYFVSRACDLFLCSRPDAAIEQDPQAASSTMRGSTRSWPTTRRAYARQASTSSRSSQG